MFLYGTQGSEILMKKDFIKKYDLAFSLGAACSCTQALIGADLWQFSSPFDWLWGSDFLGRVKILISDFDRFLKREDFSNCKYNNGDAKNLCDVYKNEYTGLVLNHDFPAGISFEKSYPSILEKYNRRINRLLKNIESAKSVLIVYIETPNAQKHSAADDILSGWQQIHHKYPDKKIDLLYLINDNQMKPREYKETILSENITKIVANYKCQTPDVLPYVVDNSFLVKLLSKYRLNISLSAKIKKQLLTLGIHFIPVKSLRKKLRKKYHIRKIKFGRKADA